MEIESLIRCPKCYEGLNFNKNNSSCNNCGSIYSLSSYDDLAFVDEHIFINREEYEHIQSVSKFWNQGWENRNSGELSYFQKYNAKEIHEHAKQRMGLHSKQKPGTGNLWFNEINFKELEGKTGLNIGCGTGAEAAYLISLGKAQIIAIDVTAEATHSTQLVINKIGIGRAIQADARYLPIKSNSIDFVYSCGVLHHSRNIQQSIDELYRVLKPNGVAYIGLYSKTSLYFQYINLKSFLSGAFTRKKLNKKLSSYTEPSWRVGQSVNPHTRIFGRLQCKKLFSMFASISVRGGGLTLPERPIFKIFKKSLENSRLLAPLGNGLYIKVIK